MGREGDDGGMMTVEVPGRGVLELRSLVLDFNGTLAADGSVLPGVVERVNQLATRLEVHVFTADTFGTAAEACQHLQVHLVSGTGDSVAAEKDRYVAGLGSKNTIAIGNGVNDHLMLKRAALGVAVIGTEGAAVQALLAADIAVAGINDALDLLLHPQRLVATLRA